MEVSVLIVEDEVLVAENLSDFIKESGFNVCGIAINSDECFDLVNKMQPDIVILDISLKGRLDGIEIARMLTQTNGIPFIFVTANTDPATIARVIPLSPAAFLSKPFNNQDVKVAIEIACQKHNSMIVGTAREQKNILSCSVFVREGGTYKRIDISSILYIEAKGSYSQIVTTGKSYTLSYNLNHFTTQVKSAVFKKVHRSYIVNINRVEGFNSNSLLINKTMIPVSKQYQKEIMTMFMKL